MLSSDVLLFERLKLVDETVGTIQRTAAKIAALPPEARRQALYDADRAYALAMLCPGQDAHAAARWVELVMTAVRALVAEIDDCRREPAVGYPQPQRLMHRLADRVSPHLP
jgi:hypothetical protein